VKDQRAPLRTILVVLPAVVLAVVLGSWAPAGAQAQFDSMKDVLAPTCGQPTVLGNCGCNRDQLNNDELRAIAPDELASQGSMTTAVRTQQLRVLGARLASLRGGAPTMSLTAPAVASDQEAVRVAAAPTASDVIRTTPDRSGRFGVFINGTAAWGDRDRTDLEEGYDFNNYGVTGGADYRFTPNLIAGAAFSYYRTEADINDNLGTVEADSFGITLYGTYYVGDFFIDLLGGFMWNNYDTERLVQVTNIATPVNAIAKGDTEGQQYTVSAGVGYQYRWQALTLTPLARLDYVHLHVNGYNETGGGGLALEVKSQNVDSLQSSLGAQVGYAFPLNFGVLVPQVRGEWRHEFLDDQRNIRARFLDDPNPQAFFATETDKPDRDYFVVAAGLSAVFARGISAFVNYETFLGLREFTRHEFTGGVRVEF
jgi:outer membrane lipase/esterase